MTISVTLRFTGDLLNPGEITTMLNVVPRISRRKGDRKISSSKKEIISKFGLWTWKSDDPSNTLTIDDHIKCLKDRFQHAYDLLPNLPNVDNAWVDICIVDSEGEGGDSSVSLLLSKESTVILSNIGLSIEFTIYRSIPEDE
ncbi:DUF4279 domain-containing protein [Glaciimonas sp. Cout2]|uniref:DUF4279 domain-containing protein n=1 Tax=Glaciimonas sp. Cout2 TaxID=3048621 RepID=UPI002B233938|nr:DUF4279 domain-containing protein [Glaciimonas sp. Cout2]MEB0011497.1 DUF4279 domain-containing protein [Glaciimonas sp. Cout2]